MNDRGQFHLLELGIGILLLFGLFHAIWVEKHENFPSADEKIRLCHDLMSVWTYNIGNISDLIEFDTNGSENQYACTASRIRMGMEESITVVIR